MQDLSISNMMAMQRELFEPHKHIWPPMEPAHARDYLLYMMEEVGECIAIMKKKGDDAIAEDPQVRQHFVEEMCDVLMFFTDTLLSYGITPEEVSQAYRQKHCRNMGRDYEQEYENLFS